MPDHVHTIRIDWHYDESLPPQIRQILLEANAQLTSSHHTRDTFRQELRALATRYPGIVADAFVEDGLRQYWLYRVRPVAMAGNMSLRELGDRRVEEIAVRECLEHTTEPIELPLDEALVVEHADGEVEVPFAFSDESELREVLTQHANLTIRGGGRFVAEAGYERFLVELAPGRMVARKLVVTTEPELVARLMRGEYAVPPKPPRVPHEKYEQPLYWPRSMLDFLQEQAMRTDRSLSYIAQLAFKESRAVIAASDRERLANATRGFDGDKQKQTLYFPGDMLDAMDAQARRLDSSLSFVVQSAVALARDAIRALPTAR